ncbi:MAG: glycerophosphodiester phosphodiesterase [Acidimicrobiia bacterium]
MGSLLESLSRGPPYSRCDPIGRPRGGLYLFWRDRPTTSNDEGASCTSKPNDSNGSHLEFGIAPITFAHRGARLEARENSLSAFARALEFGASGLESDVRLSADGTPVLAHDATFRRGLRRYRVDQLTPAELADLEVPTVAALFDTCGSAFDLSLDLKVPQAARATLDVVRAVGAIDRLWCCSPDMRVLFALRESDPDVHLVHSSRKRELAAPIERHAARLAEAGIAVMNMHHTDWTAGIVSLFHRFSVRAFAWDVQEVRNIREMVRIGIDGLYCDRPDRLVSAVAEFAEAGTDTPI